MIEEENSSCGPGLKLAKDTTIFGVRSLVVGISFFSLVKIMSSLGHDEGAASSIIMAYQGLMMGASTGFITSVGSEISVLRGNSASPEEISSLIKTGLTAVLVLGGFNAALCWSTNLWLPHILENPKTAYYVSEYMKGYSGATLSELAIVCFGQIVFKIERNSWYGLIISSAYRLAIIGMAYMFVNKLNMGILGVGLGCTVTGFAFILFSACWFLRKQYREMPGLYEYGLNFCHNVRILFKSGWKFTLQRSTEWGNLFIIAQIIGAWSNERLLAYQPSALAILLTGLFVQGFSLASMLVMTENSTKLRKLIRLLRLPEEATGLLPRSRRADIKEARTRLARANKFFVITNVVSLIINALFVGGFLLAGTRYLELAMPGGVPEQVVDLAKDYLLINLITTFPDVVRVVSSNALKAWDNLLFAIINSLVSMTVIAIPVGFTIGLHYDKDIMPLFYCRLVAVCSAAILNIVANIYYLLKSNKQLVLIERDTTDESDIMPPPSNVDSTINNANSEADCTVNSICRFFSRKRSAAHLRNAQTNTAVNAVGDNVDAITLADGQRSSLMV